jgi:putative alpha-1,2-mannosidase
VAAFGNRTLTVLAESTASSHSYIQKVWLNDKLLDWYWIRHAEIAGGGTLRFEMSSEPAPIR